MVSNKNVQDPQSSVFKDTNDIYFTTKRPQLCLHIHKVRLKEEDKQPNQNLQSYCLPSFEWALPSWRLKHQPSYWADLDAVRAGVELTKGKVQAHPNTAAHPEGSVKRLGEVGVEGVKMRHAVCHAVEGQRPWRQIQVDAQAWRVGDWYILLLIGMHGCTTRVWQLQGPGPSVIAETWPGVWALPAQSPIGYTYRRASASPLYLPVTTLDGHRPLAHHLGPTIKTLWSVRTGLCCPLQSGFSIAFRDL